VATTGVADDVPEMEVAQDRLLAEDRAAGLMKKSSVTGRRTFLATATAAAASTLAPAPGVGAQPTVQWRMSTTWTKALEQLQRSAQLFAKTVEEMSGGRFRIEVFPGGQVLQPFECFDAASRGTIEAFMGTATYWADKEPATEWFATIPFGMNPEGMTAWLYQGDGLKLWEETYARFNLVPRPGPAFAPQMGGWFRKKINTIGDFKGLKMRVGNSLARKVIARAGGTAVLTPAADIYAALERGVIDTAEWVGPHDDMQLGLHNTARYYYYPGWHEPGTMSEFTFNRKAYEALPLDLRLTLDHAAAAVQVYGLTDFHAKNAVALERLKTEFKGKVEVLQFPAPVLRDLRKLAAEVVRAESETSPLTRKVHASFTKFQAVVGPWDDVAEGTYHKVVAG
jgi:TRAP-type mannitol/chloroaromatic compound transport system substrate-binding protein